ncbi:MAG: DUF1571 domain-containing protein [Planctomycetaceae bacterium]
MKLLSIFVVIPALCFSGCVAGGHRHHACVQENAATDGVAGFWSREKLARDCPIEFLNGCIEHYDEQIRDYRCTFQITEKGALGLSETQRIAIQFRENPYSVDMKWIGNTSAASRICYVKDRWVKNGRQMALVVPSGVGGLILPGGIKLDIHGREFRRSASHSVDEFGFRKTLERFVEWCEAASGDPAFSLTYSGRVEFEGRPQYAFERRLPAASQQTKYPDRLSVMYVDAEWLVPIAVWNYADEDKHEVKGEYLTFGVTYNVGLADSDFE